MSISRSLAITIWLVASIFYAYQYIIRVMPSIMIKDIMNQYGIDAAIFGQFTGIYYIGYSLMHLPIGIMLDRFGPRKVMSICILLTVVGTLPVILSEYWIFAFIGRFLIGVGSSAAILGTFKIIRMSFEEKVFTRMLSISVTIGLAGAIYGGAPVRIMMNSMGYKDVIILFAVVGLMLALITYLIVPEVKSVKSKAILSDLISVATNKRVMAICILAGLMIGPLEGFADVWGPKYFANIYGLSGVEASYYPSLIFVGMCFGAPLLSLIAEKTGSYYGSIIGAGIVMFSVFLALVLYKPDITTISLSFILVGICCAYQILAIYKATTYVEDNLAGITTATANMIIMSFGYFFHSSIGIVIELFREEYGVSSILYGTAIIPICILISIIGFLFLSYKDRSTA